MISLASRSVRRALAWLAVLAWCAPSSAAPPAAAEAEAPAAGSRPAVKYVRLLLDEEDDPLSLQTAVVTFQAAGGDRPVAVDLIGAVHVADKSYYQQLNQLFESYDVVLYELVAPEGTRIPKGGGQPRGDNPVSAMQGGMKQLLDLEFQLEQIDYTRDNLLHADMTPQEFAQSTRERGDGFLQLMFRMMGAGIANQAKNSGGTSDTEMLLAFLSKDRAWRLKRIMARQFDDLERTMSGLMGPEGSTIITERNKKALEVLAQQIKEDKRRIAIFYGAGHLSDMAQRLERDFGLVRGQERWLTAWDLSRPQK